MGYFWVVIGWLSCCLDEAYILFIGCLLSLYVDIFKKWKVILHPILLIAKRLILRDRRMSLILYLLILLTYTASCLPILLTSTDAHHHTSQSCHTNLDDDRGRCPTRGAGFQADPDRIQQPECLRYCGRLPVLCFPVGLR